MKIFVLLVRNGEFGTGFAGRQKKYFVPVIFVIFCESHK